MQKRVPITVAQGNGIGPEIMDAVLTILESARAQIDIETIEIGESLYLKGNKEGIEASAWDSLRKTKVFLKAPITTPQGGGFKSLNVVTRKKLGLYANVRPCVAYSPFIHTKHPGMDVVIVRENEEDVYAGIEHRQTVDVYQCLKLITRPGTEKIVRYAFEYAKAYGRKKVTCFSKDNIMKMTDGLFHRIFNEIGEEYPDLEKDHWIIDIGAAKLADSPELFDVIVMANLYGDILSDVALQISGSVGLGGSSNIGENGAMFEAVHGSAPMIAGQGIANPSGLLLGAILMLNHIGQGKVAEKIHNAWLKTVEDGIHTPDIYNLETSKERVGTKAFTKAVIDRLGQIPRQLKPVHYGKEDIAHSIKHQKYVRIPAKKELVGCDIFIDYADDSIELLSRLLQSCEDENWLLAEISNRGTSVWPDGLKETFCTDHYGCRFLAKPNRAIDQNHIIDLLARIDKAGLNFIKTEGLYSFDQKPEFSGFKL